MPHQTYEPSDMSVRQFVADRRRRAVPKDEALAIFAAAPVIDVDELRSDLDAAVAQDLRDL
jgi:hypothetical protein